MAEIKIDDQCFHRLNIDADSIESPSKFTFPFCYTPHPLSLIAADALQKLLQERFSDKTGFGIGEEPQPIGKMFGVLVVQNQKGEHGFLASFSGKLIGSNDHVGFVPPVFDLLKEDGFYKKGEASINAMSVEIEALESSHDYLSALGLVKEYIDQAINEISEAKAQFKVNKALRNDRRSLLENISEEEKTPMLEAINLESIHENYRLKDLVQYWKSRIFTITQKIDRHKEAIESLRKRRKAMSMELQMSLFNHYSFLNAHGQTKDLNALFNVIDNGPPPSGAGECAAPKLLQYAYINKMQPICMAEFWWGPSPVSEVRKHGLFYPSCKSKCEPILGHMLEGLPIEDNPLLANPADGKTLDIVYEDSSIIIVNKPAEFLSVPGIYIKDSVQSRMEEKYAGKNQIMIVHRLDMSTSGLIMLAKNKEVHKFLQHQFIKRTIQKRYVALLDGLVVASQGTINLPIRLDLDNRPAQLVDYELGKTATTRYEVIERHDGRTKVYFYPQTGRTHQLRIHAAHTAGLNAPIVGDDIYGQRGERLYLHAESITFLHPETKLIQTVQISPEF